jgi:hypothetical protein
MTRVGNKIETIFVSLIIVVNFFLLIGTIHIGKTLISHFNGIL